MVYSFLCVSLTAVCVSALFQKADIALVAQEVFIYSPLFFFAFVMLTEPLTTPPTKRLQIWYGALVGLLFAPQTHIGSIYFTPEYALVLGNIFSYIVSPKEKLKLILQERREVVPGIYDFIFSSPRPLKHAPGQYLEWTLGHAHPDSRGNRRYFTVASSPTEHYVQIGVKLYEQASSFKRALLAMRTGDTIMAAQLAGDFVLPKDKNQPCVFIAGGIGITPFRSMIKYMLDTHEQRSVTLFYSTKTAEEIVYRDIFDQAQNELGLRVIYTLTDTAHVPAGWNGSVGIIDAPLIKARVPDYAHSMFYLSGPHAMVAAFEQVLAGMGVERKYIKTDFFPGFV